jgi:hypothetical protein
LTFFSPRKRTTHWQSDRRPDGTSAAYVRSAVPKTGDKQKAKANNNMKANLIRKTTLIDLCALTSSPAVLFAGKAAKTMEERGMIKSVDTKPPEIVVIDKQTKSEGTFKWSDQTKFTEQGKTVSVNALKAGLPVQITYTSRSGTPMLERVKISPVKAQKHSSLSRFFHPKS